ncbi:GDP-6-deoxy-D-mannose reductase [subsurface metagenome]
MLVAKNLFDVAVEAEFDGKIVLIGNAAEYGIQNRYTEFCVEKPQSIYGLTKLMQYSLFKYYISTSYIKANYIRLFNVIDTHLSNELFIGNFTRQVKLALKGDIIKEITLGNLNPYKDFLLIDDVYTGFMKVIKDGSNGGVYNLGMGEMILLDEFVEKVLSQLNLQLKLVIKKINSVGNIKSKVVADITKIRSVGWSPKFDYKSLIEEYSRRLKKEILNEKS